MKTKNTKSNDYPSTEWKIESLGEIKKLNQLRLHTFSPNQCRVITLSNTNNKTIEETVFDNQIELWNFLKEIETDPEWKKKCYKIDLRSIK